MSLAGRFIVVVVVAGPAVVLLVVVAFGRQERCTMHAAEMVTGIKSRSNGFFPPFFLSFSLA